MLSKSFHISLLIYIIILFIAYTLEQDNLLKGVIPVLLALVIYYLVFIQVKILELTNSN